MIVPTIRIKIIIYVAFAAIAISSCLNACQDSVPKVEETEAYKEGASLAKIHCSACHAYVSPDLLDRITWPRVLRVMKMEMDKKAYVIDPEEWIKTQQFYLQYAPKVFVSTPKKILPSIQTIFEDKEIQAPAKTANRLTLLKYIEADSTVYIGTETGSLFSIDEQQLKKEYSLTNIPVDLKYANESLYVLGIGSLKPSEAKKGQLLRLLKEEETIVVDSLKRPVHFLINDLEEDGINEYLIASFGSTVGKVASGKLSLFKTGNRGMEETILEALPGAIQVEIADINKNGRKDIIGLFTQGNEQINLYVAQENGTYKKKKLIEFPPVYGTNSFALSDINKDGYLDILVTTGDNDDYSPVFKAYHGIRIYLNDQQNNFSAAYFYQINGASKVKVRDMDKDGDLDFIVLAMYPDLFSRPWETLLYFEQTKQLQFTPQYFEDSPAANWMLLEVADIDKDGDEDILTAANIGIAGLLPPKLKQNWLDSPVAIKVYYNQINDSK